MVIVASVVLGTWLAALPYGENDPCLRYDAEDSSGATFALTLWPAGHVCHVFSAGRGITFDVSHRPSVLVSLLLILQSGAVVAVAISRRSVATRGAMLALTTLALVSVSYHFTGEFAPAVFVALFYGSPITLAVDWLLRPAEKRSLVASALTVATVPPIVVFAWSLPYFWSSNQIATVVGALAGALALIAGRRLQPTLRSWGLA